MEKAYKERVKNFEEISARHVAREIEGCTSWRHFVVHQDRGWLLNAFDKIQNQVEKIREIAGENSAEGAIETEVNKLLNMFEKEQLKYIGDEN
jgi:hypothetical protein